MRMKVGFPELARPLLPDPLGLLAVAVAGWRQPDRRAVDHLTQIQWPPAEALIAGRALAAEPAA